MNAQLEQRVQTVVIRRIPPEQALQEIRNGNKFVVVEREFDANFVPDGYTLIKLNYKQDTMNALVPQSLLFFMVNPGEGNSNDALEEIADFYSDAKNFEGDRIDQGETSIQESVWTTNARSSYQTYLINKLVKSSNKRDDNGEPLPEFNSDTLNELDLNDDYVIQRVKAMAALMLKKSSEELKEYGIDNVLNHMSINKRGKTLPLSREEFNHIFCDCGSHYELRQEFNHNPDFEDSPHRGGTKTQLRQNISVIKETVAQLEKEITDYRVGKHGSVGRHDILLMKAYANMKYIAKEDPTAQLDIMPPNKEEAKNGT